MTVKNAFKAPFPVAMYTLKVSISLLKIMKTLLLRSFYQNALIYIPFKIIKLIYWIRPTKNSLF